MKIIKPQRLSLLTKTYDYEGRHYLAVNAMAFFAFGQPQRLLSEVSMWKFAATAMGKDTVLDMGMPKQRGEFLVYGKCHAPQGTTVTAAMVSVKVGAQEKKLHVFGERCWEKRGPLSFIGEPQPFTAIDLDYRNAFGGEGFAFNPTGKGMPPAKPGEPHLLPHIENPAQPVALPDDRPAPASMGQIDFTWPQRASKAGTYDDHWLKTRFPGFAQDMDWSLFNAAAPDQWLPAFFAGDESFEIRGMHPQAPVQKAQLPRCAVRCLATQRDQGRDSAREIPMRPETLMLFPGAERGILMFRGVMEIATDDAADIVHLLVGAEELGAARPLSHYQGILDIRLDRKQGALHALNDAPLLPPMPEPTGAGDAEDDAEKNAMEELIVSKGLHRNNVRRRAEKQLDESKQRLAKMRAELVETHKANGLPPPDLTDLDRGLALAMPADPVPPTLEELPAFQAEMNKVMEKAKSDSLALKARAEAQLRETCAAQKLDYDEVVASARRQGSGPPKPIADKTLKQMRDVQAQLVESKVSSPELERQLADAELPKKLRAADAAMLGSYRKFAHVHGEVPPPMAEDAARQGRDIQETLTNKGSFQGRDFTGADFSGMSLAGADFSGALLESANFSGADLRGANFAQAVLARAVFTGSQMAKASFAGANLGFAQLGGVNAAGASFAGALMAGADLSGVDFTGADLSGCDLMGARMAGANFSGVRAAGTKFIQVDLKATEAPADEDLEKPNLDIRGIRLAGADLTEALFLQCRMDDADFSGATLDKAIFLTAVGSRVNFSGARMGNVRVVKDSRLDKANFTGARMEKANLRGTDLKGGVFTQATLTDADLSETSLSHANLRGVDAANLRLNKADLTGADLSGANLLQASLQKAQVRGALFLGANLYGGDLLRIQRDGTTVFDRANMKKTLLKEAPKP